ncbi:MAG: hypothetical protein DIKNOCCD_01263 [bacterium]|nr:hypothetical protein [bacterium]
MTYRRGKMNQSKGLQHLHFGYFLKILQRSRSDGEIGEQRAFHECDIHVLLINQFVPFLFMKVRGWIDVGRSIG